MISRIKLVCKLFAFVILGASRSLAQSDGTVTGAAINGDPLTEDSCEVTDDA